MKTSPKSPSSAATGRVIPFPGESTVPEPPTPINAKPPQGVERTEAVAPAYFLEQTKDRIVSRFLGGQTERSIARHFLGGRKQHVARVDVEVVIRERFRAERILRVEFERRAA